MGAGSEIGWTIQYMLEETHPPGEEGTFFKHPACAPPPTLISSVSRWNTRQLYIIYMCTSHQTTYVFLQMLAKMMLVNESLVDK